MASAEHVLVIVHRTEDIAKSLGGDARKSQAHEEGIFDSDDIVRTTPLRPAAAQEASKEPAAAARCGG